MHARRLPIAMIAICASTSLLRSAWSQPADPPPEPDPVDQPRQHRNFAGSIQLDYMAIATENTGRTIAQHLDRR